MKYSQTWANDHLQIATTCSQRPPFWGPNYTFYNINDLQTTTTCQQRPLILGPEDGRCTLVWLYIKCRIFVTFKDVVTSFLLFDQYQSGKTKFKARHFAILKIKFVLILLKSSNKMSISAIIKINVSDA